MASDNLCINTIRFLSVDAVEKAKSGHPGTPMGAASLAYVLWDRFLKHNPADPQWPDRDRFVLSAGHASALLYALLYLTGYGVTLDDIKDFRQWRSVTPGHPEHGLTPGVEATTGPLGQGFANGVGMALAERWLAARYNRPGYDIINHYTYALVSDGDLEEGVASEAASLAGNWQLGKIIYLYDSNSVQQDGPTVSFNENVSQRFQAYGWNVIGPIDGMDIFAVDVAIREAQSQNVKPNLIICKTVIGYGSPHKEGTNAAHGEPLGEQEVMLTREKLNWNYPEPFTVPAEVLAHFRQAQERGRVQQEMWRQKMADYGKIYPQEAVQFEEDLKGSLPADWDKGLFDILKDINKKMSTRDASGKAMDYIARRVPSFLGGAADLSGSTRAYLKGFGDFGPNSYAGRNIRYGLREHAMGSISNGLSLHSGLKPFAGTFLIFSDYMRPAIRLAAIQGLPVVYIFTHDSIALGEDGPTHQPVEQIMGLRAMPGLSVIRPSDAAETIEAWKIAMETRHNPTALILTRQELPILDRTSLAPASGLRYGGYIILDSGMIPQLIFIATGSEVHIALEAARMLKGMGKDVRVVSLPSWDIFDSQSPEYKNSVIPPGIKARISVEAGTPIGWERFIGGEGIAVGISRFGASAPGDIVLKQFGFTPEHLVEEALKLI